MPFHPIELSDEQLWEAIRRGDADAFTRIVHNFSGPLTSYGRKFIPDRDLVGDCLQDLFADIWIYRHRLAEVSSVRSYLLISFRRKLLKARKTRLLNTDLPEEDVPFLISFSIQDEWIESEGEMQQIRQLNKIVNQLPPRQKEVLYLKFHQNLTNRQIAEALDMQYQSVSNLLQRALAHIRHDWKDDVSLSALIYILF